MNQPLGYVEAFFHPGRLPSVEVTKVVLIYLVDLVEAEDPELVQEFKEIVPKEVLFDVVKYQ